MTSRLINSMPELVQALRDRRDELNVSHEVLDSISGLQSGYVSKLLAPRPIKNLGVMSFGALLGAMGLAVIVVEDPAAAARVRHLWQPRKRPQKLEKRGALIEVSGSERMSVNSEGIADVDQTAFEFPTEFGACRGNQDCGE